MKRRTQRLQVSTFPFLAVLLCAMGSLILLLLVIDRRAKAVARAKAAQAEAREQAEDAPRNGLARLTVELQTVERTLADLKWARQQQQQTYSLVPYRGRQGDERRPFYIECTAHGLVFHPDHLALEGPTFSAGEVRAE